jgi:hypothetical protein
VNFFWPWQYNKYPPSIFLLRTNNPPPTPSTSHQRVHSLRQDFDANTHHIEPPTDKKATSTTYNDHTDETLANPTSTTQEATPRRFPVDPYLQDRRDAKAAASDLRCTQQFLGSYRLSVPGRCEPDHRIQVAIMPSFHAAVRKYRAVAFPSHRARRAFCSALHDMQMTLQLLQQECERAHRARMYALARRHGFLMMAIPDRSRPIRVG